MEKSGTERIYPAAPLEQNTEKDEQQQPLLPPAPPTYDQAIGGAPTPAVTTAQIHPATTTEGGATHVVVIAPPAPVIYGPQPVDIQCPFCHNFTRTRLRFKPTTKTHLMALLLCLFQLYCCICLPYCIGSCMNTAHYCGMCDKYLGTYVRS